MSVNKISTIFATTLKHSDLSAKQQAVLTACLELFSEQGFENTSTADIAKRAGVAEGTVYKHFKTKTAILNAILQPLTDAVVPEAAAEFIQQLDPKRFEHLADLLRFAAADRLQFALDNRAIIRIVAQQAFVRKDLLPKVTLAMKSQFDQGFFPALHRFQARGDMVTWDDARILRCFASAVFGYALPLVMLPQAPADFDVAGAADEIVETLMKVFKP